MQKTTLLFLFLIFLSKKVRLEVLNGRGITRNIKSYCLWKSAAVVIGAFNKENRIGNIYFTRIDRYPIFNTRYSVMCKVYTEYHGTSEIEHGLCACTVDNPLAKARGLSLRTGTQTMLSLVDSDKHRSSSLFSSICLTMGIIYSSGGLALKDGNSLQPLHLDSIAHSHYCSSACSIRLKYY